MDCRFTTECRTSRIAISSLLAQDYPNLEIVDLRQRLDDGTSDYCRSLAAEHPRIRYFETTRTWGRWRTFDWRSPRAGGEYFMWASHDDRWSERFVSVLAKSLSGAADAVLATPAVLHICEDGTLCSEPPDRPATGKSKRANLELLYRDHAATWIFGLWRTDWVREHFVEYTELPYWGADVLWLADICLRHPVVGDQEAVIYKRLRRSSYAPRNARADDRVLGLDVLAREPHEHPPHARLERAGPNPGPVLGLRVSPGNSPAASAAHGVARGADGRGGGRLEPGPGRGARRATLTRKLFPSRAA